MQAKIHQRSHSRKMVSFSFLCFSVIINSVKHFDYNRNTALRRCIFCADGKSLEFVAQTLDSAGNIVYDAGVYAEELKEAS